MGAVLAMAASGCGGGSSEATTVSARGSGTGGAAETTATAPPRAPNFTDAKQRAAKLVVPDIRSELRQDGVQAFGDTAIQCAPTGGPETECLIDVPFMRLNQCGIARRRALLREIRGQIVTAPDSPHKSELKPQLCYIGANGESVPSPP